MSKHAQYQTDPNITIVNGVCPHDCPDTCSWQVAVDKSAQRAVDIWGHPDHPVTQGALCGKVDRYLERTYHAGRLTTPLRRVGDKGSGQFVPITWDDAIGEIAARLKGIIAEYGAAAVLPYSYAGTMGILQGDGVAEAFFNRMGASGLARTICSQTGMEGYSYTIGTTEAMATESFAQSKLILIWGSNTLTSNLHLWPFVQQARKQGARVIVIDPAHTRTARAATAPLSSSGASNGEWIAINPGTDGALALAMMHVIIGEGLHDADYVQRYTVGFDGLRERVVEWTPERAAAITGVSEARIRQLARDYATTRPAAIRINYGMQRHAGGGMAVRTIACLPALVGAWREYGGGIQLSTSGAFRHLDRTSITRPDLRTDGIPRVLNMIRLGDALSLDPAQIARAHHHPRPIDPMPTPDEAGPPVQALIVYNCNPAAVTPDQSAVLAGLRRDDLFTVVLEHFQTDTANYADIVLPATTQLEHWDILKPYGHLFLALNRPAIPPVGESLPNSEIFRRLARAMGYRDAYFQQRDEAMLRTLIDTQTHPVFETTSWDVLMAQGFARLNLPTPYLPFAKGNFPTASGKCEFYSTRMAHDGYDPLPNYTPPNVAGGKWQVAGGKWQVAGSRWQVAGDASLATPHGPLICISPPAHSFLNSSFANMERFRQREKAPLLWIHPDDAAARGIVANAEVLVSNRLGRVRLRAQVTDEIVAGTVLAPGVWWSRFSPDGRNINQITPQDETDMGAGATFYDVRVQVAVWAGEAAEFMTPEPALALAAD